MIKRRRRKSRRRHGQEQLMDKKIFRRALIRTNFEELSKNLRPIFEIFQLKLSIPNLLLKAAGDEKICTQFRDGGVVVLNIEKTPKDFQEILPDLKHEIFRSFLNDIYLVVSRFLVLINNRLHNRKQLLPEESEEKFEQEVALLNRFLAADSKNFLEFLRRIRNSVVHYDGRHNQRNALDYCINEHIYKTTNENIGKPISFYIKDLISIYEKIISIFDYTSLLENKKFFEEINKR
jgi:hypothetical protein